MAKYNMPFNFAKSDPLSLGVEMELQLLDGQTLDLTPASPKILEILKEHREFLKAEIFQSMIEVTTGVCANAHQIRADLSTTIDLLQDACRPLGIRLASAGTHPTAHYAERKLFPAQRYRELIDRNQWIARRLVIFGAHFHIGMRSGDHAIHMNNALLHYLPVLLALSASSPYWGGEDTELSSCRITFFEALPTGGHPCRITSWEQFESLHEKLIRSGAIRSAKDIWWDMRLSPLLGTLEIRICDGLPTLEETVAMAALIHALAFHLDEQIAAGVRFDPPSDWIMRENKWRASRWGLETRLIVNEIGDTEDLRQVARQMLRELAPVTLALRYGDEIALIEELLTRGPSYERQRWIAAKHNGDLRQVAGFLASEFEHRRPIWEIT